MTPPDSDDREVLKREADSMRVVEIPLPLAQRILAALEEAASLDRDSGHYERADKNHALAAELRAIVERKT